MNPQFLSAIDLKNCGQKLRIYLRSQTLKILIYGKKFGIFIIKIIIFNILIIEFVVVYFSTKTLIVHLYFQQNIKNWEVHFL